MQVCFADAVVRANDPALHDGIEVLGRVDVDVAAEAGVFARLRTLYQSQNVTAAAMQMAEKKVCAQRS